MFRLVVTDHLVLNCSQIAGHAAPNLMSEVGNNNEFVVAISFRVFDPHDASLRQPAYDR